MKSNGEDPSTLNGPAGSDQRYRTPSHFAALWLAGVLFLCFAYFFPRFDDWDQNSRFDMTLALVQEGTAQIDHFHWNTGDIAYAGGHYFSIMAPGQALFGVPVAAATKLVVSESSGKRVAGNIGRRSAWHQTFGYYVALLYLESIITVAVPSVLLVLLFFWFLGNFSSSIANRLALALAFGLGTMIFPYSQVLYSHVPATCLLFTGFLAIYVVDLRQNSRGRASYWLRLHPRCTLLLGGLALGASQLFEYPAGLVGIPIFLYACCRLPLRYIPYLLLGALPGVLALAAYDLAIYHSVFSTGYSSHSVLWKGRLAQGVGGSTWPPRPGALFGLTMSPYRGIFFLTPMFLLTFPGWLILARRDAGQCALFATIPVIYTLAISMSPFWFAGSSVGPRYLIPTLPFLAAPIILVLDRVRALTGRLVLFLLLLISALNVWFQTLGWGGFPRESVHNPLWTVSIPGVVSDHLPLSVGSLFFAPFHQTTSKLTVVPLGCFLALWTAFLMVRARRSALWAPGTPRDSDGRPSPWGRKSSPSVSL